MYIYYIIPCLNIRVSLSLYIPLVSFIGFIVLKHIFSVQGTIEKGRLCFFFFHSTTCRTLIEKKTRHRNIVWNVFHAKTHNRIIRTIFYIIYIFIKFQSNISHATAYLLLDGWSTHWRGAPQSRPYLRRMCTSFQSFPVGKKTDSNLKSELVML